MERLTCWNDTTDAFGCNANSNDCGHKCLNGYCNWVYKAIDRLGKYEDFMESLNFKDLDEVLEAVSYKKVLLKEIENLKLENQKLKIVSEFNRTAVDLENLKRALEVNKLCQEIIERYNLNHKPIVDQFGDTSFGCVMVDAKDLHKFLKEKMKKNARSV